MPLFCTDSVVYTRLKRITYYSQTVISDLWVTVVVKTF